MHTNIKSLRTILLLLTIGGIFLMLYALFTFREAKIIIEWETASEVDTVGFDILRGETPEGEFVKINEQLIPASVDPFSDNFYTYTDDNAQSQTTYYYQLLDVEADGTTTTHGPIEITATNQKWLELVLAGTMLLAAFIGKKQIQKQEETQIYDTPQ